MLNVNFIFAYIIKSDSMSIRKSVIGAVATIMLILPVTSVAQEWALPNISVANVRTEPRHGAELSTQALMGNPVKLLSHTDNDWWEVELSDGYTGYIIGNSLTLMKDDEMDQWKHSDRVIAVSRLETRMYADSVGDMPVSDIVPGDILQKMDVATDDRMKVMIPDGRIGWINRHDVMEFSNSISCALSVEGVIDAASALMGIPYLWGGLTPKGLDCSGLTKAAFFSQGVILLRDASQQARTGEPVELDALKRGDLVFFGNPATQRVNHVAIYLGDGLIIESSGRVKVTPLADKDDTLFARRIMPYVGAEGIRSVLAHPWYF